MKLQCKKCKQTVEVVKGKEAKANIICPKHKIFKKKLEII